ncbi:MAG: hypothetical protein FWF06_00645 [Symbiobacteriaceae bacterium]|nr:hypothetical protein [Symbiobacteriaceae bacterium]
MYTASEAPLLRHSSCCGVEARFYHSMGERSSWASTRDTLIHEVRQLLPVELGELGLRQSEALFWHLKQLPVLLQQLQRPSYPPLAVAASSKPRPAADSYMPVFIAGAKLAEALAVAWGVPFFSFSHQEGHIMAGVVSAGGPTEPSFLALHLSGGTTELLKVTRTATGFNEELLGGSLDLHVGQLVDRVGVALGLPFPAGPHLEQLAREAPTPDASSSWALPSYCQNMQVSFSGAEAAAKRALALGVPPAVICRGVERCIAATLEKLLRQGAAVTGLHNFLLVGGVASNLYLRQRLEHRLKGRATLWFAEPKLCSDNAVGIAWLGLQQWRTS